MFLCFERHNAPFADSLIARGADTREQLGIDGVAPGGIELKPYGGRGFVAVLPAGTSSPNV